MTWTYKDSATFLVKMSNIKLIPPLTTTDHRGTDIRIEEPVYGCVQQ